MKISVTAEVIDWIIENTLKDRSYGARPLRRAILKHVQDPLAEKLLEKGVVEGATLRLRRVDGELVFDAVP